jgi:hypothetical protein
VRLVAEADFRRRDRTDLARDGEGKRSAGVGPCDAGLAVNPEQPGGCLTERFGLPAKLVKEDMSP